MVEAANAAARAKGTYLRDKIHRLKAHRGYKRAEVAIAHKILVSIYHMLSKNVSFNSAEGDRQPRRGKRVSAAAQSPFCATAGQTRGLSPAGAAGEKTSSDLSLGDGTRDYQRLGDPPRRTLPATATREPTLWSQQKHGTRVRMGRRHHGSYYRGARIAFTEWLEPKPQATRYFPPARIKRVRKAKKDHPWQRGYQNMQAWTPTKGVARPLVGIRTSASP